MNEQYAIDVLAESLNNGTLVLFLGAGVSSGASLPEWPDLIKSMRAEKGLSSDNLSDTPDALQDAADEVETKFFPNDRKGFAELVRKHLYKDVKLDESLLSDRGLIALGALMTGSRRGSVNRVVTLNFDCILEWYLSLCGLIPRVVLQSPAAEGREDVRVYHPHGFLPHNDLPADSSNFVMLGLKSINQRLSDPNDDWSTLLRHVLTSGTALFVGLSERSFRDRALAPWLEYAANKNRIRCPDLPTGFWVLKLEDGKKTAQEIELMEQKFLASRIVPLRQTNAEMIPSLLLRICQKAAQRIAVSS
jgi:hypothetical protein